MVEFGQACFCRFLRTQMMMASTRKRTKTARQITRMKMGLDSRPPTGVIVSGK